MLAHGVSDAEDRVGRGLCDTPNTFPGVEQTDVLRPSPGVWGHSPRRSCHS